VNAQNVTNLANIAMALIPRTVILVEIITFGMELSAFLAILLAQLAPDLALMNA